MHKFDRPFGVFTSRGLATLLTEEDRILNEIDDFKEQLLYVETEEVEAKIKEALAALEITYTVLRGHIDFGLTCDL